MVSDLLMPSKVTGFLTCLLRHKNQSRNEMHVAVVSALPHTLWAGFPEALCDFWDRAQCTSGKLPLPWEVQQALLLKNGVVWRKCPQSQLVVSARLIRAALSQLIPLKGTHTHLASYFRRLGYRMGKHSQAPKLFRKIMMKKKACPKRKVIISLSLFHIQCLSARSTPAHKHAVFVPGHEILHLLYLEDSLVY